MDAYDQYILAPVILPTDDDFSRALVMRRKRNFYGNIILSRHSNRFLETHIYRVQFQDGLISKYVASLISENCSKTDPHGTDFLLLGDILDNRSTDKAFKPEDYFEGDPVNRKFKKMTAGWGLLV